MMANSIFSLVKIIAVRRMHVIREPCIWPCSPQVLRSSVVRASNQCMEGHRFNSGRGLRFFLCSMLMTCRSHHFSSLFCFLIQFKFDSCQSFITSCPLSIQNMPTTSCPRPGIEFSLANYCHLLSWSSNLEFHSKWWRQCF